MDEQSSAKDPIDGRKLSGSKHLHDEHGHFVHVEHTSETPPTPHTNPPPTNPVAQFLSDHTHYSAKQDDILDVHIGNPLRKITELLQEIKKQKAFSFTLKGSLGIMGVALALSIFGLFGGAKILCDKGVQTHIGRIKQLAVQDDTNLSLLDNLASYTTWFLPKSATSTKSRLILVKQDNSTLYLPYAKNVSYTEFLDGFVYVTGQYDACSMTLRPDTQSDIQAY